MTVEWNKVTWYSKLFALILLVVLPLAAFYFGVKYGELRAELKIIPSQQLNIERRPVQVQNTSGSNTSTTQAIDISGWKTYRNEKHGYLFRYPATFHMANTSTSIAMKPQALSELKNNQEDISGWEMPIDPNNADIIFISTKHQKIVNGTDYTVFLRIKSILTISKPEISLSYMKNLAITTRPTTQEQEEF